MVKIGYVRTSKVESNPDNQINLIMDQGVDREHIFIDVGISGASDVEDRPGYLAMEAFIASRAVETLFVFEISRLGRSFIDTLSRVIALEERGIQVYSLSPAESWSRIENKSMRNFMLAIFSWVAEREREVLIERIKAGMDRAKAEGQPIGRPNRDLNWKKIDEYRSKGLSLSAISRILDIPYSTLLRNDRKRKNLRKPKTI